VADIERHRAALKFIRIAYGFGSRTEKRPAQGRQITPLIPDNPSFLPNDVSPSSSPSPRGDSLESASDKRGGAINGCSRSSRLSRAINETLRHSFARSQSTQWRRSWRYRRVCAWQRSAIPRRIRRMDGRHYADSSRITSGLASSTRRSRGVKSAELCAVAADARTMLAPTPACRARITATVLLVDAKGSQRIGGVPSTLSLSLSVRLFVIPQIPPLLRGESHLHRCDLRLRIFHLPPPPQSPFASRPRSTDNRYHRCSTPPDSFPPDPFSRAMHHSARAAMSTFNEHRAKRPRERQEGRVREGSLINADDSDVDPSATLAIGGGSLALLRQVAFHRETLNVKRFAHAAASRIAKIEST